MGIIEKLGIDFKDLVPEEKTIRLEIPRYSKQLKKGKFYITVKSLDLNYAQEIQEEMSKASENKDEAEAVELFMQVVAAGMIDPSINDKKFIDWLGLKENATTYQILKKFLLKSEIVDIGLEIFKLTGLSNDNKVVAIKNL